MGTGFHNLTGQKIPVDILHNFGHSLSSGEVRSIELAQALKSQIIANESSSLPLRPVTESDFVLSVFWVDNFDVKIDSQKGNGMVNMTTMMAFQEISSISTFVQKEDVHIDKSDRSLTNPIDLVEDIHVKKKQELCKLLFPKY